MEILEGVSRLRQKLAALEMGREFGKQAIVVLQNALQSTDREIAELASRVAGSLEQFATKAVGSSGLGEQRDHPPDGISKFECAGTDDASIVSGPMLDEKMLRLIRWLQRLCVVAALHNPNAFSDSIKTHTDEFRTEAEELRRRWCDLVLSFNVKERTSADRECLGAEMEAIVDSIEALEIRTAKP